MPLVRVSNGGSTEIELIQGFLCPQGDATNLNKKTITFSKSYDMVLIVQVVSDVDNNGDNYCMVTTDNVNLTTSTCKTKTTNLWGTPVDANTILESGLNVLNLGYSDPAQNNKTVEYGDGTSNGRGYGNTFTSFTYRTKVKAGSTAYIHTLSYLHSAVFVLGIN